MKISSLPGAVGALLVVQLLEEPLVAALSFPIRAMPRAPHLNRRLDMVAAFGNGSTVLNNQGDSSYYCNITLGGAEFEVLIDTGSSDLWVAGDVPQATDTNKSAEVNYAGGSADGDIMTATMVFDSHTVDNQAFIRVNPDGGHPAGQGLIGLGPNSQSNIVKAIGDKGDTPLNRIFVQNMSTPNIITVFLARDIGVDSANPDAFLSEGQLTVGEVIPAFDAIDNQPKLPALRDEFGIQHWQTVLDANGVIGPDGEMIPTTTSITDSGNKFNSSQLHVIFDTGFTYPQLPRNLTDEIYGRVPGASFVTQSDSPGYWSLPCDYELNISFVLSGVKYPVSPLDLNIADTYNADGSPKTCKAAFQQISPQVSNHQSFGAFDAILGMAFLRNVYLLINFGDFVDGGKSTASPFIQLLQTVDPATAHSGFVNLRLGGVDTTTSQPALLARGQGKVSPVPANGTDNDDGDFGDKINKTANDVGSFIKSHIWIAVLLGVGVLLLFASFAYFCCCRRPKSARYIPLHDPRPGSPVWDVSAKPVSYGNSYASGGRGYSEPRYSYGGR